MMIRSVNANSIIRKYKLNQKTKAKTISSGIHTSSTTSSYETNFSNYSIPDKNSASYKHKIEQHIINYRSSKIIKK